ncbi:MAG TPA: branched-chain amino acid ABC transporter substrate-binding protein, partial [Ilumatobacteraceae bacterium]|nr:branched-chain amino acid ABC transporter substrate-binding protein [Ilumatobacteraceae bacterium]
PSISRGRTNTMHRTTTGRLGAAALGLSLVAVAACGSDKKAADTTTTATTAPQSSSSAAPGGDGVTCEAGLKLAFLGALSGDNGALGTNMVNGMSIAIDDFNAANPNCQITLDRSYDSQGDPAQATPLADTIVNDAKIIGLVGPGFSGETRATMPTFEEFGLPMISPGATNATLSQEGWKMFHRVLANDDKQAPGVAALIKDTIKATKVGVIDDATDYGKGLAESVKTNLGSLLVESATINPDSADYSAAVTAMKNAGVDAVFYSGYYAEAAKFVSQMRDAGVTATFVSGDGSLDVGFIDNAGAASEGAYLTATGAPPDVNPEFSAKFNAKFGTDPTLYSPEAYDAASVFLAGIAAGNVTRDALATFIDGYDAQGITKNLKFDATGEPEGSAVFYTIVEGGKLVSKGLIGA